jgi:hypothetical protein
MTTSRRHGCRSRSHVPRLAALFGTVMMMMMQHVTVMVHAQDFNCTQIIKSCLGCLMSENCGFWQNLKAPTNAVNAGVCSKDCIVPYSDCYINPSLSQSSAESACELAEKAAEADALCTSRSNTSCSYCVSAVGSDGLTIPCQWYQFVENGPSYCSSTCDRKNGLCGATTCNSNGTTNVTYDDTTIIDPSNIPTSPPTFNATLYCHLIESCTECLETEGCGHWHSTLGCHSFCNYAPPCYTLEGQSLDGVCQIANQEAVNEATCRATQSNSTSSEVDGGDDNSTSGISCEACVATLFAGWHQLWVDSGFQVLWNRLYRRGLPDYGVLVFCQG